eukprot:COSAG04_NODE_17870_length_457_cov_0.701117_1_plen_26_part_01
MQNDHEPFMMAGLDHEPFMTGGLRVR